MNLIEAKVFLKKIVYLETIDANYTETYISYCNKLDEILTLLNKQERLEFNNFANSLE